MPQESQLSHRNVRAANIPYVSFLSPTETTPCYVPGSQDILTSIAGYAERRPGFSVLDASGFNNLQRVFAWDRFDGSFYKMYCDINVSMQAVVYKQSIALDLAPVVIFTDTGSATPFDFVVSNNTVYFSNGHIAKKWDPVNGISNWGISIGSVNNATGPNPPTAAADVAAGVSVWANPANIEVQDGSYSTTTVPASGGSASQGPNSPSTAGGAWTNGSNVFALDGNVATANIPAGSTSPAITASNYGFSIPAGATILGIAVTIYRQDQSNSSEISDKTIQLLKNGTAVGNNKAKLTTWPGAITSTGYGSSSDLWGTTWNPSDINASNFGVYITAKNADTAAHVAGIDYVSVTVTYSVASGTQVSDYLQGTTFGFGLANTTTVLGILVEVKGFQTQNAGTYLSVTMLKSGSLIGTTKTGTMLPASNGFVSFGGTGDLWGTTWSYNDINQTNFGVSLQAVNGSNLSASWSIDFVRITVYGLGGPTVTLTGTGLTATNGYVYVFCYGNSNTGHVSSPTPQSSSVKPANQSMQIGLTASTDPQVNQIRVFRSTDSVPAGTQASTLFEIPTSPYPNTTQNVVDGATDLQLNQYSIAPLPGFNDPPTPFRGPVYFSGRIWGFTQNKIYFSALEENTIGVPEESFVSGVAGNFWNFDQPTQGVSVAGSANAQTLLTLCGGRLYGVVGNSLDTFRRFLISNRRGCRNLTAISNLGAMVAWLDSSGQIWSTDGSSMQEIGTAIRPDLLGLSPVNCSMTFHVSGRFHWLVFSTGAKLFVYDMDTEQWMPPWSFAANYVFSGETSAGNYQLFGCQPTQSLINSSINRNDNGTFYQPIGKMSLAAVVPDFGTRFSATAVGVYDEPTRTGVPWIFQLDTNQWPLADVLIMADDDPLNSATTYTSIFANQTTPQAAFNRGQGTYLVQNIFTVTQPLARWIGWQWKGAIQDDTLKVYGFFMAYSQKR